MDPMLETRQVDPPGAVPIQSLTTKQRQIVETIDAIERVTGEPCGARYLARRLNIDHKTVLGHLHALYRKGWLRTSGAPASIRRGSAN